MDECLTKVTYFLTFIIVIIETETTHVKTSINAVANTNFANVFISDVTPMNSLSDGTLMGCGKACLDNDGCMSYFYNSNSKVCKLFDQDFIDPTSGIIEAGWNYFTAVKDCKIKRKDCPLNDNYIYNSKVCMCYKYIPIQSVFPDAKRYCKENETGQLVKIDRMLKQIEIGNFLDTLPDPMQPNGDVYIQGTRTEGTSNWFFDNGQEMSFFYWNTGFNQPQMQPGEQFIAVQKIFGNLWSDTFETKSIMFICERV